MTNSRRWKYRVPLAILANLLGLCVLGAANNRFMLSGGSDAPNVIWAPSTADQIVSFGLMAAISVVFVTVRPSVAFPVTLLWLVYLLSASHRLVWDVVSSEVRDVYLLIAVQQMPLGETEEDIERFVVARPPGRLVLRDPGSTRTMTVFLGVPPATLKNEPGF
jgi:hypothetical protein